MTVELGGYVFEGPYESWDRLQERAGVYVILCNLSEADRVIDVGGTETVQSSVRDHDRAASWRINCSSSLLVAVLYTPETRQEERTKIEQAIRAQYNPPCGAD